MKRVVCLVTFLALSVAVSHVHAQETGDPREGLTLARQVCSECHAIGRGQVRSPNSRAPTFLELATAPGMTIAALSVALTTPHAGMPMFRLRPNKEKMLSLTSSAYASQGFSPRPSPLLLPPVGKVFDHLDIRRCCPAPSSPA